MHTLNAKAGKKAMVYGGEKKSKSSTSASDGIMWKERSVCTGSGAAQSGRTSFSSIYT